MTNLRVGIRNAEITYAEKITNLLYEMVENKEIESVTIKRIKKGESSVDFSPFIPMLESIDLNAVFEKGVEYGAFALGSSYVGLKVVEKLLSVISKGIDVMDKLGEKKSQMGIRCKIGRVSVAKYGRSYNVTPFDTILVSATPKSVENTLLRKNQWGEIPIAREKHLMIKHVAIFVKSPVRAIQWVGKVKTIKYNRKNKKSTIFFDGRPKRIEPIPYDPRWPHHNGHGMVYTTLERIKNAETVRDVYPS